MARKCHVKTKYYCLLKKDKVLLFYIFFCSDDSKCFHIFEVFIENLEMLVTIFVDFDL